MKIFVCFLELQTCVKHCTRDERNAVFNEIRPQFITLSSNTYAVHLVTKMLDHGMPHPYILQDHVLFVFHSLSGFDSYIS